MNTAATERFFDELEQRGDDPVLATTSGTLRWEVTEGTEKEHWFISLDRGDVSVSHDNNESDMTASMSSEISEGLVTGRVNAMAAFLRGTIDFDGNFGVAMAFQRLFPGPPSSKGPMA